MHLLCFACLLLPLQLRVCLLVWLCPGPSRLRSQGGEGEVSKKVEDAHEP